jgi:hypothetical protein
VAICRIRADKSVTADLSFAHCVEEKLEIPGDTGETAEEIKAVIQSAK